MRTLIPRDGFAIPEGYHVINPGPDSVKYGIPWIATEATMFLNTWLTGNAQVLDIGVGGSTIFYGARSAYTLGLEVEGSELKKWQNLVETAIVEQELEDTVELKFFLTEDELIESFRKLRYFSFDLISIDTFHTINRERILKEALILLKPRGVLVLDNFQDSVMWHKTCSMSADEFLAYYNKPNHRVYDTFEPGWVGRGTRLVIPTI
jgi:predicted O-methyltransferase YrrM